MFFYFLGIVSYLFCSEFFRSQILVKRSIIGKLCRWWRQFTRLYKLRVYLMNKWTLNFIVALTPIFSLNRVKPKKRKMRGEARKLEHVIPYMAKGTSSRLLSKLSSNGWHGVKNHSAYPFFVIGEEHTECGLTKMTPKRKDV